MRSRVLPSAAVSGRAFRNETAAARSFDMSDLQLRRRRGRRAPVRRPSGGLVRRGARCRACRARPGSRPASRMRRHELGLAERLRRLGAGHVVDALLEDGAVEVVGAEAERDLRQPLAEHHPVGLDVVEVVEHQARHGVGAQAVEAGRLREAFPIMLCSGWNASGMNAWNPPVSSCSARRRGMWSTRSSSVSIVPVEHGGVRPHARAGGRRGGPRATRSAVALSSQIFRRTRAAKISAPPPGSVSSPASRSSVSTCS